MNEKQLKDFAREIISHQINETIGDDEEIEAWKEIEDFFKTEFEEVVENIQKKFKTQNGLVDIEKLENQKRIELLEKNKLESEKIDMWEDEN